MNKIVILIFYTVLAFNLLAQPVDGPVLFNEKAYSKAFLDYVTNEKYFAKYAIEAHHGSFELTEKIKCKLHIPYGINKVWQDLENSNLHKKGDYDYSKDFWIGIRFNFYVGGVLVSSAFENFEKPKLDTSSFTFYFDLDPLDFEQEEGDINFAFIEFIKKIKKNGSQLVIEATLPSKNFNEKTYSPIVSGSFRLRFDDAKYREWLKLATDYNIQLKQLANSTMKRIFGETGFSKNFTMSCLQNPCSKGYLYANTLVSNNPCATEPQDSCKEAIITYSHVKKGVPLSIKILVSLKDNGEYVYIENNQFGSKEINIAKQNLLTVSEIQKIITKKFPKDSLTILADVKALSYSQTRIRQTATKDNAKFNSASKKRLIRETKAGKNWKNGFIYSTQSQNPRKPKRIYQFDAVTGKLLWITEIYKVTNDNHSH
jgi:hypothetical protein